jgi:predicted nuclease of predicted toxin-antitoxin system
LARKSAILWAIADAFINSLLFPHQAVAKQVSGRVAFHRCRSTACRSESDVGLLAAKDTAIWDFALQEKAVIVSKDEDFPRRLSQSATGPAILWLRIGNSSRHALLD